MAGGTWVQITDENIEKIHEKIAFWTLDYLRWLVIRAEALGMRPLIYLEDETIKLVKNDDPDLAPAPERSPGEAV